MLSIGNRDSKFFISTNLCRVMSKGLKEIRQIKYEKSSTRKELQKDGGRLSVERIAKEEQTMQKLAVKMIPSLIFQKIRLYGAYTSLIAFEAVHILWMPCGMFCIKIPIFLLSAVGVASIIIFILHAP